MSDNKDKQITGPVIGIDLGTTNSCVSICEGGNFKAIENEEGCRTTPSIVAYSGTNKEGKIVKDRIVGSIAKRQAVTNINNTIMYVKRIIGKKFSEVSSNTLKVTSYKIVKMDNDDAGVQINIDNKDEILSPIIVSADILIKMKSIAENYLGYAVHNAVITVPAYFNDSQRQATKDAGKIAGLNVLRIINEPTAACMAYGVEKKNKKGTIAVYDLGGGTFDISILSVDDSGVYQVLATSGDTYLGGTDFDDLMIDYALSEFKKTEGIDLTTLKEYPVILFRVREACEIAKKDLSSKLETEIVVPFVTQGPKNMNVKITRMQLNKMCSKLVSRSINICKELLTSSSININEIDYVILVGGMTRMILVQEEVEKFFNKKPSKDINPDECVSIGAAIQGSILTGETKDIVLIDVTPLSLGVETAGGIFTKMISRNTAIPTKSSQIFTTATNNQTLVTVRVFQGEREFVSDNKFLAQFDLTGIKPASSGVPKIEVTFSIDANGIVNVDAVDKDTNIRQEITIKSSSHLSKEEIDKMAKEADEFKERDSKRRELVELRLRLDRSINSLETIKNDVKEDNELISEIDLCISESKTAMESEDVTIIKTQSEKAEQLYIKTLSKTSKNNKSQDNTDNTSEDNSEKDSNT